MPYGDEGELFCERGWYLPAVFMLKVYRGIMEPLGDDYESIGMEMADCPGHPTYGFARFWNPGDKGDPFGGDGGVRLSRSWKFGYIPATWVYAH